jgi:hypothetical protein
VRPDRGLGLSLTLMVLLAGCREPFSDEDVSPGYYRLFDINERVMPTVVPCGGYIVHAGEVVIRSNYRANYSLLYTDQQTGDTVTFVADGDFRRKDKHLELDLRGRWSNRDKEETLKMLLRIEGNDVLYHDDVGAECDNRSTEAYLLRSSDQ